MLAVAGIAGIGGEVVAARHSTSAKSPQPNSSVSVASSPTPTPTPTRTPTPTLPSTPSTRPPSTLAAKTTAGSITKAPTPTIAREPSASHPPATTHAPKIAKSPAAYVPSDEVRPSAALSKAVAYAKAHGNYRVGMAVFDTQTGKLYGAGLDRKKFATESVVKAFIAARLLATGTMTPIRKTIAYKMITQSDDASGTALYGAAGGDGLVAWIEKHYGIDDVGSSPTRAGWWGNTHITAVGMVRFYAAVKHDPAVWPWLSDAMHHAKSHGSDGTYQFFGLKQADDDAAIKQGWGQDDDDWRASSDFNSTGFLDDDRYAVAILLKGPRWQYHTGSPAMVTSVARKIVSEGHVDLG